MERASERTRMTMVVSLIAAQILHETLDELAYTTYYRHKLKQACNNFEKELTKTCDTHITGLYANNDLKAREFQNSVEQIAKHLANMKPSEIMTLEELLTQGKIQFTDGKNIESTEKQKCGVT